MRYQGEVLDDMARRRSAGKSLAQVWERQRELKLLANRVSGTPGMQIGLRRDSNCEFCRSSFRCTLTSVIALSSCLAQLYTKGDGLETGGDA